MRERLTAWASDSPRNLAVFRITVGLVLLWVGEIHDAARWAATLPDEVRTAPVGLGWTIGLVPMTPALARGAQLVMLGACVTGTLGLLSRTSFTVVALSGVYVLGVPQFAGAVFHHHHLVWFAAVLAASPCGDALALDRVLAQRRGRPPPPERALAYGVPLRVVWLLIGCIFFFPGLWKLITSGTAWIFSDNLRNQMYAKWAQMDGFTPLVRIDRHPWLVRAGALGVVVFELAFPVLVLFRRTRLWAVAAALLFHQATGYLMGLRFPALWLCYTAFVDWDALARWARRRLGRAGAASLDASEAARRPRTYVPALVVGGALLAGAAGFGAAGESGGWPFACYPKFARLAPAHMPAMHVELVYPDGRTRRVPAEDYFPAGRTQRYWALTWSLIGAHATARASPERFRAFGRRAMQRPPVREAARDASAVRFYYATISTVPEERDEPPLARKLLHEMPL